MRTADLDDWIGLLEAGHPGWTCTDVNRVEFARVLRRMPRDLAQRAVADIATGDRLPSVSRLHAACEAQLRAHAVAQARPVHAGRVAPRNWRDVGLAGVAQARAALRAADDRG